MLDYKKNQNLLLIFGILFLIVLCFTVYGEVLGYYFTSIDAFPILLIGKIDSLQDIAKMFFSPLGGGFPFGTYYRPLSELSYGIDYLIWGRNPMGYHLTDIVLHLVNSIMVFITARIFFRDYKKGLLYAWVSSILFLISPLSSAIVPSLSRRQDMIVALLICLSLLTFAKVERAEKSKTAWYTISLILGFFAVFSKESAFVLPILIGLLSFIFNEGVDYRTKLIKAAKYSTPYFGLAVLNTVIHIFLFGFWGVHVSSGFLQHVDAAIKSFFTLAGPLELLNLSKSSKALVLSIIVLSVFLSFLRTLYKYGIHGFFGFILDRKRRLYTYLITFVMTFVLFFTVSGKSSDFYHYLPTMAMTILIVMVFADTFEKKGFSIVIKSISVVFVLYTIIYSPVFTNYSAWRNSSEITRQTIEETEAALNSDRDGTRIFLINWPGFIGRESDIPGTKSTILVSYSMDAWAEWSGIKSSRDVEFIHISYTYFPSGSIRAKLDYIFSDNKIDIVVKGCQILPSKIPYKDDVPFKFRIEDNKSKGELVFTRKLGDNERLFLYDVKGIRIIDSNFEMITDRARGVKS